MEQFLGILILVPTAAVVVVGILYIVAMIVLSAAAGIDALVVTAHHRADHPIHWGRA